MKFNVCGGLDAPDWILAHMAILSKISAVRITLLAGHIIGQLLDGVFEYEEVLDLSRDSSLGDSEVKACVAVLHFFIVNAAKFDIDESTFSKELQQLGLPKEHSDSLCKPFSDNKESLQARFLQQSLQVPSLRIGGWQVQMNGSKSVVMRLTATDQEMHVVDQRQDLQICMAAEKFQILLRELKVAKAMMEELQ